MRFLQGGQGKPVDKVTLDQRPEGLEEVSQEGPRGSDSGKRRKSQERGGWQNRPGGREV